MKNREGYDTYGIKPKKFEGERRIERNKQQQRKRITEDGLEQEDKDGRRIRTSHASKAEQEAGGVRGIP